MAVVLVVLLGVVVFLLVCLKVTTAIKIVILGRGLARFRDVW